MSIENYEEGSERSVKRRKRAGGEDSEGGES